MENHQSQTRSIMFSGTSPQPTDSSNASPDEDQKVDQVLRQSCQSSFQIYYSPSLPETHDLDIQDKALIATAAIEQTYSGMSLQSSVLDDESLRVKANERVVSLLTVCTETEDLSETNDSTTPAPPATLLTPLEQLIQLAPVRYLPSSPFLSTLSAPGFNFEFNRRNFDTMQGAATSFLSEQDRFNKTMQQKDQQIRMLQAQNARLLKLHGDPAKIQSLVNQNVLLTSRLHQILPKCNELARYAGKLRNQVCELLTERGERDPARWPGPIPHVTENRGFAQQQAPQPIARHQTEFQTQQGQFNSTAGAPQLQNTASRNDVNAYLRMQQDVLAGQNHQSQHIPATQSNTYAGQTQPSQSATGAPSNGLTTYFQAMPATNAVQHANNNFQGSIPGAQHGQNFNNRSRSGFIRYPNTQRTRRPSRFMPGPSAGTELPNLPPNSMFDDVEGSDLTYLRTEPAQTSNPMQQQTINTQAQLSQPQINGASSNDQPQRSVPAESQSTGSLHPIRIDLTQEPAHADLSQSSSPRSRASDSPNKQSTPATSPELDIIQQNPSAEALTAEQTAAPEQQAAEGSGKWKLGWYISSAPTAQVSAMEGFGPNKKFKDANGHAVWTDHPKDDDAIERRKAAAKATASAAEAKVYADAIQFAEEQGWDDQRSVNHSVQTLLQYQAEQEREPFKHVRKGPAASKHDVSSTPPVEETEEQKKQKDDDKKAKKAESNKEHKALRKARRQQEEDQAPEQAIPQHEPAQKAQRKEPAQKVTKGKKAGKELSAKQQAAHERLKQKKDSVTKITADQMGISVEELTKKKPKAKVQATPQERPQVSNHSRSNTVSTASFDSDFHNDSGDDLLADFNDNDSLFGDDDHEEIPQQSEPINYEEQDFSEVIGMLEEQAEADEAGEAARAEREKYLIPEEPERPQYSELIIEDDMEAAAARNAARKAQEAELWGDEEENEISEEE